MKVGTDGVLLGAWSRILPSDIRALDIGCGTGLIALMLAQRSEKNGLHIDAVEIDEASAEEAAANVQGSPWPGRVSVICDSVQDFSARTAARYDLIVSNPPFFSGSLLAPDPARAAARHAVSLTLDELLVSTNALLSLHGRFCVVIPSLDVTRFLETAARHGLTPGRITDVYPKPRVPAKRCLIELRRSENPLAPGEPLRDEITIELSSRHDYSPEYISLTSDFYLKF